MASPNYRPSGNGRQTTHLKRLESAYCLAGYNGVNSMSPRVIPPQWGAADAQIKVPSDEDTELKGSPFIAWSRSVYSHTCYAYCQGFLPC